MKKTLIFLLFLSFFISCGEDEKKENPKTEGTNGGVCRTEEPKCDSGLICNSQNRCEKEQTSNVGKENGPCTEQKTCDQGLTCDEVFSICKKVSTTEGEEGGPCDSYGNCNGGLLCMNDDICKRPDNNCNLACGKPEYKDTKTWGGPNDDDAKFVVSTSDKVYIVGKVKGQVDLNPSEGEDIHGDTSSYKDSRSYLAVYDKAQNYLSGYVLINNFSDVNDMAADSNGNLYILGNVNTGTHKFNFIDSDNEVTIPKDNRVSVYLTKINSDGSYGWTHIISGESFEYGTGVDFDSENNPYIFGHFEGYKESNNRKINFDFTGAGDEFSNEAHNTLFITKINSDGTYQWTKLFGEAGERNEPVSFAVNQSGIYITGLFDDSIKFSESITVNALAGHDSSNFIAKLDLSGEVVWGKTISHTISLKVKDSTLYALMLSGSLALLNTSDGSNKETIVFSSYCNVSADDLLLDGNDIYIRGYFECDKNDFNPNPLIEDWKYSSSQYQRQFISKYKNDCYCWTETFAKEGIYHNNRSMAVSGSDFYFVGSFSDTLYIDGATAIESVDGSTDALFTHWEIK